MSFLLFSGAILLQQAGGFFCVETWDNNGTELPPGRDWFIGGVMSLGDVDGDGVDDLAAWVQDTSLSEPSLEILFLKVDGSVRSSHTVPLPTSVTSVGFFNMEFFPPFAIGDVNGDGVPDLGSVSLTGMHVIRLTSTGDVVGIDNMILGDLVTDADVLGDLDGNGIDELVTSNGTVLFLDASGALLSEVTIGSGAAGYSDSAAGIGDLNSDGIPDVAFGKHNGFYEIQFLKADGTSLQNVQHFTSFGGSRIVLDAFDLDGDGRKELTCVESNALSTSQVTTVFLNPDGSIESTGLINTPADLQGGIFWGFNLEYHSDGRLLVTGANDLDLITLIPSVVLASATFRNAGTNAPAYGCVDPVLGATLTLTVDAGATGHLLGLVIGFDSPANLMLPGGQTVLTLDLNNSGELVNTGFFPGPIAQIPITVPKDLDLLGFAFSTQGASVGGTVPFALSNACDLVIGL